MFQHRPGHRRTRRHPRQPLQTAGELGGTDIERPARITGRQVRVQFALGHRIQRTVEPGGNEGLGFGVGESHARSSSRTPSGETP